MAIKKINEFLERIKRITPPDIFIREEVKKEIEKTLKTTINIKDIKYSKKENIIYINLPQSQKTEIFFNKEKILNNLKSSLQKKSPEDIL